MEKYKEIERSIIKKFRKDIWSKFVKAIQEYELIKNQYKRCNLFNLLLKHKNIDFI